MIEIWLMVISVCLYAAIVAVVLLWRRQNRLNAQMEALQLTLRGAADDLVNLCAAAVIGDQNREQVQERLAQLDQTLQNLIDKQNTLAAAPPPAPKTLMQQVSPISLPEPTEPEQPQNYQTAIDKIRLGASVEDLIKSCGLTRDEALLLTRMHAR
jgi:Protein of unknown function (DUF2802)